MATASDLDQYVVLAKDFHEASPMNGVSAFDVEGYGQFFQNALNNPDVGIWLAEIDSKIVGITGAMVYPLYFSPTHLVAQELWWWWIYPLVLIKEILEKLWHPPFES